MRRARRTTALPRLTAALALVLLFAAAWAAPAAAQERPELRVAVLKFGTVNWLMATIADNGLDAAEGFSLRVAGLAGKGATTIAFQAGDADVIVNDWIWMQRRRDAGDDLRFSPYSTALGALMARPGIASPCDLRGRRVGVVGGANDKSWLVFRAWAKKNCGFDIGAENALLFGAPPLMARQLAAGDVDAVSTYWHWAARLEAGGMTRLLGVEAAMADLGISPAPPLIGFVWDAERTDAALMARFLRAAAAAQDLLAASDAQWERLRPRMKAKTEAEFLALRERYRAGIARGWSPARMKAARALHALLIAAAGPAFATAGGLDEAAFAPPDDGG